jgi:hypothetical protein
MIRYLRRLSEEVVTAIAFAILVLVASTAMFILVAGLIRIYQGR